MRRQCGGLRFFRISLDSFANQKYIPASPCRHEGRFAIVTKRGAGCDGRLRRQAGLFLPDETFAAYGEIVWSWRRDRGVKRVVRPIPRRWQTTPLTGESTYKP